MRQSRDLLAIFGAVGNVSSLVVMKLFYSS